jgi:GNAT superfamily N-acetyltransferase
MSVRPAVEIRPAEPADHARVREVLIAAYLQYRDVLAPELLAAYLADLVDLDARTSAADLLVAEADGRVVGTATFYADARDEGYGWPAGWAGIRAVGVHPSARGLGAGRVLVHACIERARALGTGTICLHTADFMTAAVALYESLGFRREPSLDLDVSAMLEAADPGIVARAYTRPAELAVSPAA